MMPTSYEVPLRPVRRVERHASLPTRLVQAAFRFASLFSLMPLASCAALLAFSGCSTIDGRSPALRVVRGSELRSFIVGSNLKVLRVRDIYLTSSNIFSYHTNGRFSTRIERGVRWGSYSLSGDSVCSKLDDEKTFDCVNLLTNGQRYFLGSEKMVVEDLVEITAI